MIIFEIAIWKGLVLFALSMLNLMYIIVQAFRWRSQDRLIARALDRRDD